MIYTAIDTFYLSQDQLNNSPSLKDGIDPDTESLLRIFGCELIQEGGIFLKLPQAVMATGQVLFQRFYCKKSFARFNVKRVAAACVWLAAKLEESPKRIQHVLNVFHRMECRRENKPLELLEPFSKRCEELKIDLIRTERHLLKEMGFICHVEHPHKFIINYLSQLEASPELMQEAWNLANDSLRTTLSVRFKSEVVACGVVHAAARRFKVSLPENPPWWKVFDAEKEDIDEVVRVLAGLYRQSKAKYIEVVKDSKSFLLTSRAWDPPPNIQDRLASTATANGTRTFNADARESIVKAALDKLKNSTQQESKKPSEQLRICTANGELTEERVTAAGEQEGVITERSIKPGTTDRFRKKDKEPGSTDRFREKDKDRSKSRDGNRDRDRDRLKVRDRDREKAREKDLERERERAINTDSRSKERSKDSGYLDKVRHRVSSQDNEYRSSYKMMREKQRHRHHPYT